MKNFSKKQILEMLKAGGLKSTCKVLGIEDKYNRYKRNMPDMEKDGVEKYNTYISNFRKSVIGAGK